MFELGEINPLMHGETEMECLVCGKPTKNYKMSIFGQIPHPLCQEHEHYAAYVAKGRMGVYDPADPKSMFKRDKK